MSTKHSTSKTRERTIARRFRRIMLATGGHHVVTEETFRNELQRAVEIGCALRIIANDLPPGMSFEEDDSVRVVRANLVALLSGALPLAGKVLDAVIVGKLIPRSLRGLFEDGFRDLAAEGGMIEGPDESEEGGDLCLVCNGPLIVLGDLGRIRHYRCRDCGCDQEKEKPDPADPWEQSCPRCNGPATPAGRGVMTDRLCTDPSHDEPSDD